MADKTPTLEELTERLIKAETYIAHVHKLVFDVSFKDEVFRRMAIEADPDVYSTFASYMPKYQEFISKVMEISKLEKIIDKVMMIKNFNENSKGNFTMYADDTNILETINKSGELSKKTFDLIVTLPHTEFFASKLNLLFQEELPTN